MKLRIAAAAAVIFMIIAAASCEVTEHVPGEAVPRQAGFLETDIGTELTADLPDADYEGYNFRILHWHNDEDGGESVFGRDLVSHEETGDLINDAVYRRNLRVTGRLNIAISAEYQDCGVIASNVINMVTAADDAFDLVYIRTCEVPSVITGKFLSDLKKLPHVDLKKPWWDANAADNLSIAGKLYLAASDINVIDKDATSVILFNRNMAAGPKLPDLYYMVQDGRWTIDAMVSLYKDAAGDVDGVMGEEVWGFIAGRDVSAVLFNGAGSLFASKDGKDLPVSAFESEYNYAVTDKIIEIMNDGYNNTGAGDAEYRRMFEDGQGLFFLTRLAGVTALRGSETDFGILPVPKYRESQERYYNPVSIHTSGLMSVPLSASDPERTSVILETMAYESSSTVQPAYKESVLRGKYARDDESSAALDIIFANRVFDMGIIFGFGGIAEAYESTEQVKNGAASLYAQKAAATEEDINAFIKQMETEQD